MEHRQTDQSTEGLLDRFAFWALVVLSLALPIIVLPSLGASPGIAKLLATTLVVITVTLTWSLARLRQGWLVLPRSPVLAGGLLVVALSAISAAWSGAWRQSFLGFGSEPDTVSALVIALLFLIWAGIYFRTRQRLLGIYLGLLFSALALFLAEILAVLILNFDLWPAARTAVSLTVNGLSGSLIGKWHDFGVYAGLVVVLSLVMLEFFSFKRISWLRWLVWVILILALVMTAAINYSTIWVVLGLVGVLILIYKIFYWGSDFSSPRSEGRSWRRRIFWPSFLVIVVAVVSLIFLNENRLGHRLGEFRERLGVTVMEVKPSWRGTWQIANQTLSQDPKHFWFGAGPSRFVDQWVRYKPATVNQTEFWNTDFRFGVGFLPSMLVTSGVLGLSAWLFFLGTILVYGFRSIFDPKQDRNTRAFLLFSWLGTVYLWLFALIYAPGNGLLLLTFFLTGLFGAVLIATGLVRERKVVFADKSRFGLAITALLILLMLGSIFAGYLAIRKGSSLKAYQTGLMALAGSRNDLTAARTAMARAHRLNAQDAYLRALSELDLALATNRLNRIEEPTEADWRSFSQQVGQAVASAKGAVAFNAQNYLNWLVLGRIYGALIPLGLDGVYEQSLAALTEARKLNPTNPSIPLDYFAQLAISRQDLAKAREDVAQALAIKPNYWPAILLLAQIEAIENRPDLAAKRLEQFLTAWPQYLDAGAYFQLGYFEYQAGDYRSAVVTLERALGLSPHFADAKYFLGLSLVKLGRNEEALRQFREVKISNPDRLDLDRLISELATEE